jgi:hypothetical protein
MPDVSVIHCGVVMDLDTEVIREYGPDEIDELVADLERADVIAGHNFAGYDAVVLEKLAGFNALDHLYLDTLAMSRCLFPGSSRTTPLVGLDIAFARKHGEDVLPSKHHGRHTLKAWSTRLQLGQKGKKEYTGGWEKWSLEMQEYCKYDVIANVALLNHFLAKGVPQGVFFMESALTYWMEKQKWYGVRFDSSAAIKLLGELTQKREDLRRELQETFPPIEVPSGPPKIAKADRVCRKYEVGHPKWFPPRKRGDKYQLYKTQEFNPGSEMQVAARLKALHGWKPNAFTPSGRAQVTAEILSDLPYPEAAKIAEYAIVEKIIGSLSEGKQAWLGLVDDDDLIHGTVIPTAATTSRASHSGPNLAQVPSVHKPYGLECRALFGSPRPDHKLVGADASSLQLALYSHFVARHDGGKLASICGDPDGDPHEYMRAASGLFLRNRQKNLTYGTFFGAGHYKQGQMVLLDWKDALEQGLTDEPLPHLDQAVKLGQMVDARMRKNMAGYEAMQKDCRKVARRGFLTLLDGRTLNVKQARLVLVTLLQGNEAVIMKTAYLFAVEKLRKEINEGLCHPCLWIHDEIQFAAHPYVAEDVGKVLAQSIADAGDMFKLRLQLRGEYKVGDTWADTH